MLRIRHCLRPLGRSSIAWKRSSASPLYGHFPGHQSSDFTDGNDNRRLVRWGSTVKSGPAAAGKPPRTHRGFGLHAKDKKREKVRDVKRKRAHVKELREQRREEELMEAIRLSNASERAAQGNEEEEEFSDSDREKELEEERIASERFHAELKKKFPDMIEVPDDEIDANSPATQAEIDRIEAELEEQHRIAEIELEAEEAKVGEVEPVFYPHELIEKLKGIKNVEELIDVDLGFSPEEYRQMIEEENAEDIVVIDISKKCNFAKSIIIATTQSTRHRVAIAEKLRLQIQKRKRLLMPFMCEEGRCLLEGRLQPLPAEAARDWISVDGDTVLINLFSPDRREYYDLETFWTKEAEELPSDEEMIRDIIENYDEPERQSGGKKNARKNKKKKKNKSK